MVIIKDIIDRIKKIRTDRDWDQFHTPANLSKAILIEAGELLATSAFRTSEVPSGVFVKEE